MQKLLLLGDEAIAQGAIDAGMSGIYGYPGTPSTEIIEYVQRNKVAKERDIHRQWSANEKTAMEAGLGMSWAGKRAMVTMKHVGLNVAADAFVNSAISGANGGLIVTVADDPSQHSSQNEQDSRFYGKFALTPVLEPTNQQEAYDMAYHGFELSEKLGIPVILRITTRLAHSRSGVIRKEPKPANEIKLPNNREQFVLLPSLSRIRYQALVSDQQRFEKEAEESAYNIYTSANDKSWGIIATGIAYNYVMENFPNGFPYPILKISQYPTPTAKVRKIVEECEQILVVEEGFPYIEEGLTGILGNPTIHGKLDGYLPRTGELNPNYVAKALGLEDNEGMQIPSVLSGRPPAMCPGCGHMDVFRAVNEVLAEYGDIKTFSDIGCYTLGALEPFKSIETCIDMGASITMAKGAADAGIHPAIAIIGDSTFTHSGMTGLLDAITENTQMVLIISDNDAAAMTGGQFSPGQDKMERIVTGLGVNPDHVRTIKPLPKNHDAFKEMLQEEVEYKGISVIVARRECVRTLDKRMRDKAKKRKQAKKENK